MLILLIGHGGTALLQQIDLVIPLKTSQIALPVPILGKVAWVLLSSEQLLKIGCLEIFYNFNNIISF